MSLQDDFSKASEESKTLSQKPDNATLLRLYSLFKQATEGDIQTAPPENPFDIVGKAKHEAWSALKGTPRETAMQDYVDLVAKLKAS